MRESFLNVARRGAPARYFEVVREAFALLRAHAPEHAPDLRRVRIDSLQREPQRAGLCVEACVDRHSTIWIDPAVLNESAIYIGALLAHEQTHVRIGRKEREAHRVHLDVLRRLGADEALVQFVEREARRFEHEEEAL